MPDPIVAPVVDPVPAAAVAVDPSLAIAPSAGVDLDTLSATELQAWRMDGSLPSTSPVTAPTAVSPAAPVVQDPPASTDAPAQATTEVADPPVPARTKARMDELLADRTRERERADRLEQRNRELERQRQRPPDARPAASSAAPAGLVKPDAESFPYGTADPGYLEALTDYKVAVAQATQRTAWEEGQRVAQSRAEHDRVMAAFHEKAAAARVTHPDFDAVAMQAPTLIEEGGAADLFILENKPDEFGVGGAEILYHLQQPANRAEQARIVALPIMDQLIALVRLGDRLKTGVAVTRSTQAPPPPPVLSTRATPADAVERAIAADDTAAYNAAMNARELAARKGK